jgi:hypothetical protein
VADRTPSLAEEARHLHACLFRAPLNAVAVARYEAALREMDAAASPAVSSVVSSASPVVANVASNVVTNVVAKVVALRLDAEAVEFALRRRGPCGNPGGDLARRMQILCYLVEVQPAYLGEFINVESSRGRAWAALLRATLRSAWKLVKGEYLVRRHGLV